MEREKTLGVSPEIVRVKKQSETGEGAAQKNGVESLYVHSDAAAPGNEARFRDHDAEGRPEEKCREKNPAKPLCPKGGRRRVRPSVHVMDEVVALIFSPQALHQGRRCLVKEHYGNHYYVS